MTSKPHIYPEYCHELSPTIKRWCPLRATDVHALQPRGVFNNGRELYYSENHPVKWVRLTGVIVAVDEFSGRRLYTLDDSSGLCIECICPAPEAPNPITIPVTELPVVVVTKQQSAPKPEAQPEGPTAANPKVPWDEVDVGAVVKIKGGIREFRAQMQVEIIKVEVLKSTDQEVRCWDEVLAFRRDVLGVPWVVSKEMEEKYKRRAEKEMRHKKKGVKGEGKEGREGDARHKSRVGNESKRKQQAKRAAQDTQPGTKQKSVVDDRDAALHVLSKGHRRERKDQERRHDQKKAKNGTSEGLDPSNKANFPSLAARRRGAGEYDALGI